MRSSRTPASDTHDGHGTPDNAYGGLVESDSDARWAFGTGFDDPLAGLDASVPAEVDAAALAAYCLGLGDDALLLAQRLLGWCTHAPELEEEVALANIALDLLGQTRLLYARAAVADPSVVPSMPDGSPVPEEDRLAFFRDADQFRAAALAVAPDADFAAAVVRLTAFSAWRLATLESLRTSSDPVLAAVAEKGVKEVRYHRDYAARWVIVLAGGTDESARRVATALEALSELLRGQRPSPTGAGRGAGRPAGTEPAGVLVDAGVAAPADAVWSAAEDDLARIWAAAGLAGTAPGHDTGSSAAAADTAGWTAELVRQMQTVARQHPMGRW